MSQIVDSSSQKLVLICLANYVDQDGICWPGQKRLGQDASMTDRSVRTALNGLEGAGFIIRKRRKREDGTRTSDEYQLMINRKNLPLDGGATGKICTPYRKNLPGNEPVREPSVEGMSHKRDVSARLVRDEIWELWPIKGRRRSSQKKTLTALASLLKSHDPQAIVRGVKSYLASDDAKDGEGQYVPGLDRWLRDEKFEEWARAGTPGGTNWRGEIMLFMEHGCWRPDGPEPGKPGCKAPADILAECGFGDD